jgi:lipopolysaccharide/colanic/teichoic acid biosynthesis glycosyltransferase
VGLIALMKLTTLGLAKFGGLEAAPADGPQRARHGKCDVTVTTQVSRRPPAPEFFASRARAVLALCDVLAVVLSGGLMLRWTDLGLGAILGIVIAQSALLGALFSLGLCVRSYARSQRDELYAIAFAMFCALAVFLAVCVSPIRFDRLLGLYEVIVGSLACAAIHLMLRGRLPSEPETPRLNRRYWRGARLSKRFIDLALVLGLLPFVILLGAVSGLLVLFDDGMPVVFVQSRVGRDGRPFRMFKFRTMKRNSGGSWTVEGDPRITRSGAFLRRTSLDELPQLINVLRGEMSLVGPRPEMISYADEFIRTMPRYADRSRVEPGITGWAQVMLPRTFTTDFASEVLAYDLYYVDNWSVLLDGLILVKTAAEVLFHDAV